MKHIVSDIQGDMNGNMIPKISHIAWHPIKIDVIWLGACNIHGKPSLGTTNMTARVASVKFPSQLRRCISGGEGLSFIQM